MTKLTISIFGSTGSVGKTTLNIIRENKEKFDVKILTANSNINDLILLANEFNPDAICFANESDLDLVKKKLTRIKSNIILVKLVYWSVQKLLQIS